MEEDQKSTGREGGTLEGADIKELKKQAQVAKAKKEEAKADEEGAIFDWDGDDGSNTVDADGAEILDEVKAEPSKEELGGGIVIEKKTPTKQEGVLVGPMANEQIDKDVQKTMADLDMQVKVAKQMAAIKGETKVKPQDVVVEVLLDKTGMRSVEFSSEERSKMEVSKKIKVTEIEDTSLKAIKISKPKAAKVKTVIAHTFEKQYAPFVALTSGYIGKMRQLSSFEIINLMSINENSKGSADAILQKASLIYKKLKECSIGEFESFDEYAKKTSFLDMSVQLYGLIRATYPEEEEITMNCGNPECTHNAVDPKDGKTHKVPNQFVHKYKNTDILMADSITPAIKEMTAKIYNASFTLEDAQAFAEHESILNSGKRFGFGDNNEILIDIYCPSIYDMVENVAKRVSADDYSNPDAYAPAIQLATFVKAIYLKNEDDDSYAQIDDVKDIVEVIYNMSDAQLEVFSTVLNDNILDYQYKYGFKASTVVCPHCGKHFKNDVPVEIEYLLFLQAQRHMTNA